MYNTKAVISLHTQKNEKNKYIEIKIISHDFARKLNKEIHCVEDVV